MSALAHPLVDFLLAGGLSIATLLYFVFAGQGVAATDVSGFVILYLAWFGNGPHFAATSYRLYHSRSNIQQYPFTAILIPFVVVAGIWLSLLYPTRVAPYFVKLYLLWSPFHYSGQTMGLTSIYARRAGAPFALWERRTLLAFVYLTFIASTLKAESTGGELSFFGIRYPVLGIPPVFGEGARFCLIVAAVVFLVVTVIASRRRGKFLPLLAFVPPSAQACWFIWGPSFENYFQLVPFFHGIQYLLVAWFMQMQEKLAPRAPVSVGRLGWETARWGIVVILGGLFLFSIFPQGLIRLSGQDALFVMPVAIAGVQIHHFFVDGVIWKLRNPTVGSPLQRRIGALLPLLAIFLMGADWARISEERVVLRTNVGDIVLALYPDKAPRHVEQILKLVKLGVYDTTHFYKVERAFMQLSGVGRRRIPATEDQQKAIHKLKAEFNDQPHRYGTVTMAHNPDDDDSAETSFLITLADVPSLDRKFTVVGEVSMGHDVLEAIKHIPTDQHSQPLKKIEVEKAFVVANEKDLAEIALRPAQDRQITGYENLPPGVARWSWLALVLGALAALVSLRVGAWLRPVGLTGVLVGAFGVFISYTPMVPSEPWLGLGVFTAALFLFYAMSRFETS